MKEKYIEDLQDIKDIMNRSSRFISLSGLSGIAAGIIALLGAYLAYQTIFIHQDYQVDQRNLLSDENLFKLILIGSATVLAAIVTGIYFTTRETKKRQQRFWDLQTRRLLINLFIPLGTGGMLCLILLHRGYVGFMAPLTLIFYGLALVNASKYTLNEIRGLGLLEIVLGILAMVFIGYGLVFWCIGFGLLHIVYGILMQWKS